MKFIYFNQRSNFFSLDGEKIEVRKIHFLLGGLITWTTKRTIPNRLTA